MIQGKLIMGHENLSEIIKIWDIVFKTEGRIPVDQINTASKDNMIHALVYEGADLSCPVAAGRMSMDLDSAEIELIAVLKEYRGKEYGDFVVRMLLDKAKTAGIQNIIARVPVSVVGFYHKLGFTEVGTDQDAFGLECILMRYSQNSIKKCCKETKNV